MATQAGSGFIGFIFALLLALLFWFWGAATITGSDQGGPIRVPAHPNGQYQLPTGNAVVIDAVVNRGPLPPIYQAGYEITIDATGHAVITVTPPGGAPGVPHPSATPQTIATEIGVAGLQRLLGQLSEAGFFTLRNNGTPLIGGPESAIAVTLADGIWQARAAELDAGGQSRLQHAQQLIAAAVRYNPS